MIKKKICMLGAYSAGKTSLVRQFVESEFSEKYLTTVGVKVDKKQVQVDGRQVDLLIWDIHGEDVTQDVSPHYLRGSAGYLLVVDGTRQETLTVAKDLARRATTAHGKVPMVLLLNKADLTEKWEIDDEEIEALRTANWPVVETSAKTGQGVEEAFDMLARDVVVA